MSGVLLRPSFSVMGFPIAAWFMGMAWVIRKDTHTATDVFRTAMPTRRVSKRNVWFFIP